MITIAFVPATPVSKAEITAGRRAAAAELPAGGAWLVAAVIGAGAILRLLAASATYLNPDEAFHYFVANQTSLADAYHASIGSAHPPLLVLFMYYWRQLGDTELLLRLPSVIAGALSCWLGFKWLARITDSASALVGLMLLSLSPTLFMIEAELRQYSFLLLFVTATLYFLEISIQENSTAMVPFSTVALALAVAVHYSGLLFAIMVLAYALIRWFHQPPPAGILGLFGAAQLAVLGEGFFFFKTHISQIRGGIAMQTVADSWLRKSLYHPGDHWLFFTLTNTYRLFHYLFAQPVVGSVLLLSYFAGLVFLFRGQNTGETHKVGSKQLGFILLLPLVVAATAALAGVYPFGGTRHSLFVAPFVIAGASIGWSRLLPSKSQNVKLFATACLMLLCGIFLSPYGTYLSPKNQSRRLMISAVKRVRLAAGSNSLVLIDQQTNYLFRYYFCRDQVVSPGAAAAHCGEYRLWLSRPLSWMFTPASFDSALEEARKAYGLKPGDQILVFQTGWSVNKEPELRSKLAQWGCRIWPDVGENIVACLLPLN